MITLHFVKDQDCRLIWEWANDSVTRANSFSTEMIPWEDHQEWFSRVLADPACKFFIIKEADHPVGQIRLQIQGVGATISVSIAPDSRGKGYGSTAIGLASEWAASEVGVRKIFAYIKPANIMSIRSFQKVGYLFSQDLTLQGQPAKEFIYFHAGQG